MLAAVDSIRKLVIDVDAIELARRLRVLRTPGLAAVEANRRATIIRDDHVLRVVGINPEVVKISVRSGNVLPVLAAVR